MEYISLCTISEYLLIIFISFLVIKATHSVNAGETNYMQRLVFENVQHLLNLFDLKPVRHHSAQIEQTYQSDQT